MRSKLILKLAALSGMVLAVSVLLALASAAKPAVVRATANPLPPLIGCPNVDGSTAPNESGPGSSSVSGNDILAVVKHYSKSYGQSGYAALYDFDTPYNSTSPLGTGKVTGSDIIYVVHNYGRHCPLVDTQIAKATLAIMDPMFSDILCDPNLLVAMTCGGSAQFLTENPTFLNSRGYWRATPDVSGQGVHYVNSSLWDGVFNPVRPEGLVYNNGVLAAQLYIVNGDAVGWGTYAAAPCIPSPPSCPGAQHGVDLEAPAGGPHCTPACSWDGGYDGWHVHYYLCTEHVGTTSAFAIPGSIAPSVGDTQGHCQTFSSESQCPVPLTIAAVPCYTWGQNVGWMGHLWNWLPNANLIPDIGTSGTNGRFADCYPEATGSPPPNDFWGPFNCPA